MLRNLTAQVILLSLSFSLLTSGPALATEQPTDLPYQTAPAPLQQVLDAPFLPAFLLSPNQQHYLLLPQRSWPDLADLAEPELRLAGLRFNPRNVAPSRNGYYTGLSLHRLGGSETPVTGLPEAARLANLTWSPDSQKVAFTHTTADQITLWVLDVARAEARQLSKRPLNKSYGTTLAWTPDSQALLVKSPTRSLPLPPDDALPAGPVIFQSLGKAAPGRTYQDLLKSPADAQRFSHYLHSQLLRIDLQGQVRELGAPGLIVSFEPSPDGRYLLVEAVHEPFSYTFPIFRFPRKIMIWDAQGQPVKTLADLPLADKIPISFDAVRTGPRDVSWRADAPASLAWFEALDQGDPAVKASQRDALKLWPAPFNGSPRTLLEVPLRLYQVDWGNGQLALAHSDWYQTRKRETWLIQPDQAKAAARKVQDYSSEDSYNHPGTPLRQATPQGKEVLLSDSQGRLFLSGQGASAEGDMPFVDRWDPLKGQTSRLWRSQPPYYEQPLHLLDTAQPRLITRREAQQTPPNYLLRDIAAGQNTPLTAIPHPFPEMAQVKKEQLNYTRADGLPLSATLYLPPDYKPEDGPLPTLVWAYPREYKTAQAAGQVKGSPHSFVRPHPNAPAIFATQGYAVLDQTAMPIIGEGEQEPNDTYVSQLVANAEAAINKAVAMGVADRERMAIAGHSYGAFMTANLLAHSRLFRAGIARSGAYNRTLTPFGFQSEQRTYWEAPAVYQTMSPLMNADKIQDPLLLIHGAVDNNSGTYPMQSEYFYQALKGLGAPVRLVMLPHESHGYQARESLGHVLWEMTQWLDTHVKNAPPRKQQPPTRVKAP